jgi:hypothetical protein
VALAGAGSAAEAVAAVETALDGQEELSLLHRCGAAWGVGIGWRCRRRCDALSLLQPAVQPPPGPPWGWRGVGAAAPSPCPRASASLCLLRALRIRQPPPPPSLCPR